MGEDQPGNQVVNRLQNLRDNRHVCQQLHRVLLRTMTTKKCGTKSAVVAKARFALKIVMVHVQDMATARITINAPAFLVSMASQFGPGRTAAFVHAPPPLRGLVSTLSVLTMHHTAECSNKGLCDRTTGICTCFPGYDGLAYQRSRCPDDCNGRGSCFPERILAIKANREYSTPWDANKHTGCFCDAGYRGASCELQECPTTADVIGGFGNEAGRDCSGRGICNYETGVCDCFTGFYGEGCDKQSLAAA